MTAQGVPTTADPPPPHRESRALAEALDNSDNALNLVRLGLALMVIFGHAFPLGGFAPFRWGLFEHSGLHGQAVEGFFAISGYLILGSALRLRLLPYLWRRFLRIYPGFVVAVVVTAFVLAPIGARLEPDARWEAGSAAHFVLGALDLKLSQDSIGHTLLHVPWPQMWNGSLWTLFYEGLAYVGVGVLVAIPRVRTHLRVVVPVLAIGGALLLAFVPTSVYEGLPGALAVIAPAGLRLGTWFAWGMLAHVLAARIRIRALPCAVAWAVFLLTAHLTIVPGPIALALTLPSFTLAVLLTGALLPWRLGAHTDISYGMYVYAFPIQQLLVLLGVTQWGWFVTAAACAVATVPIALISWFAIERPALSWKRVFPRS